MIDSRQAPWFALLMCLACAAPRDEDGQPRDSAGITIVETRSDSAPLWRTDSTPVVSIGGPGAGNVELFRVTAAVRLPDGRITVADGTPRLMLFSSGGQLLRTTGKRGAGPGEFEAVGWIQSLPGDSLLVYDPRLMRASVFADSLTFARTMAPDPTAGTVGAPELIGMFRDRTFLASSRRMATTPPEAGRMVRPSQVLYRHAADGAVEDSLTTVVGDEAALAQGVIVRPPFAKRTRIAVGPNGFFVAPGDRFEISAHAQDGSLRRIFRRATPPLPVTDADLAKYRLSARLGLRGPLSFPAISGLLSDEAGFVWAEAFRKEATERSRWTIFDPDGRVAGMFVSPNGFRPLQIGEDFMVGVWQDELGVEEIRVYKLDRRPAA